MANRKGSSVSSVVKPKNIKGIDSVQNTKRYPHRCQTFDGLSLSHRRTGEGENEKRVDSFQDEKGGWK